MNVCDALRLKLTEKIATEMKINNCTKKTCNLVSLSEAVVVVLVYGLLFYL